MNIVKPAVIPINLNKAFDERLIRDGVANHADDTFRSVATENKIKT